MVEPFEGAPRNPAAPEDTAPAISCSEGPAAASPTFALTSAVDAELDQLPNDLTRMIYLASLRDCNTGLYLHPQLSTCMGVDEANHRLRTCHSEIFRRLLVTTVSNYVTQLGEYIRYTRTEKSVMLANWKSLRAYRATVPTGIPPIWSELFFLNVDAAIAILQRAHQEPVP